MTIALTGSDLRRGETVRIFIERAVVVRPIVEEGTPPRPMLDVRVAGDPHQWTISIPITDGIGVEVTRLAPPEFEDLHAGDTYISPAGKLFVYTQARYRDTPTRDVYRFKCVNDADLTPTGLHPDRLLAEHGPLERVYAAPRPPGYYDEEEPAF
jgi:hypothetical protein